MKVGIVLDNPRRDLSGVALVAYQLLKRRHEVYVIPMYDQGYDVPLIGIDVIIVNYVRTNNIELLRSYKELGIGVVVLDTEGGVFPQQGDGSPEFWAKRFREIGGHECVDKYLFWGERLRDAFNLYSGLPAEKLIVTGCPRYDLCDKKWRPVLSHPRSGHVLVNLNFPSINPWWGKVRYSKAERRLQFPSATREMTKTSKIVNVAVDRMRPLESERMRALNEYVLAIQELATRNPSRTFVVRPHPFENMQLYREVFGNLDNVIVDPSGEVAYAIANADLVLHLNCSTSVETRLLGKLPVALEFLNSELLRFNVTLPGVLSYAAGGIEQLDNILKGAGSFAPGIMSEQTVHDAIYQWFYKCDGRAAERVALATEGVDITKRSFSTFFLIRKATQGCRRRTLMMPLIQGLACQMVGSYALTRMRVAVQRRRRVKYVGAPVLQQRISEFARCEGGEVKVEVTPARNPITQFPLATFRVTA